MKPSNWKPLYSYLYIKSPIAKIAWGIVSVVISLAVLMMVGLTEEARMEDQTGNWIGREIEKGAALYSNNCSSCHGPEGKGGIGVAPALQSRYFFSTDGFQRVYIDTLDEEEQVPEDVEILTDDAGRDYFMEETAAGRIADVEWAGSLADYVELTLHAGRPSKVDLQWAQVMPTWGQRFGGPLRDDQILALTAYVMNWEESALAQTPEEDPWIFFNDSLSVALPYDKSEPGYDTKVEQALAAAEAARERNYTLNGVEYVLEVSGEPEGPRAPQTLFVNLGCGGCHQLEDPDLAMAGPYLGNVHENAPNRVEGQSAEEYIRNSIINPNEYVVEGFQSGMMLSGLADQMSDEEFDSLIAWLLDPERELP